MAGNSIDKIDVSLTDFIDFAIKAGTPKLTKVRTIRSRGAYHPAMDYWKPLREQMQALHHAGTFDRSKLKAFATMYSDVKKRGRYTAAVAGYLKHLGKKEYSWFIPPFASWTPNRLRVRVNPELGLKVGDQKIVLKLYFKDEQLSKQRIDLLTFLMKNQLQAGAPDCSFCVLDVANGKTFPAVEGSRDLMPLLMGEAAAFVTMYDGISD